MKIVVGNMVEEWEVVAWYLARGGIEVTSKIQTDFYCWRVDHPNGDLNTWLKRFSVEPLDITVEYVCPD